MRTVIAHEGDTIQTLAVRHLGNASEWRNIVTINTLDYPYLTRNAAPYRARGLRVLEPGDALLVPTNTDATPAPTTIIDAATETYGIDVAWHDRRYELLMEGARPGTDRALINLAKALYRRLITRPGELPAHPEYGCRVHRHLGKTATDWRARLAAVDVTSALMSDPRVRSAHATAEYTPDEALRVTALVTPIPPAETTLTLTLTLTPGGAHAAIHA